MTADFPGLWRPPEDSLPLDAAQAGAAPPFLEQRRDAEISYKSLRPGDCPRETRRRAISLPPPPTPSSRPSLPAEAPRAGREHFWGAGATTDWLGAVRRCETGTGWLWALWADTDGLRAWPIGKEPELVGWEQYEEDTDWL